MPDWYTQVHEPTFLLVPVLGGHQLKITVWGLEARIGSLYALLEK